MRRTLSVAVVFCAVAGTAQTLPAVFVDDAAHYVKSNFYANQQWPWPYQCPDRIAVREPFCIMVNNGWRRQNLLGQHYFKPGTNELTTAGELRVQWIMTQAPPNRRSIYLERTLDQDVNAQRLAVVREFASKVSIDGQLPQVEETYLVSEGRPAAIVDVTSSRFLQSMPAPVLPAASAGSSSSSSSGQ
jgi:hypothetical protein